MNLSRAALVGPIGDMIYALYPHTGHVAQKARAIIEDLVQALADPPWEGGQAKPGVN